MDYKNAGFENNDASRREALHRGIDEETVTYRGHAARWEKAEPLPSDLAQSLTDFFE